LFIEALKEICYYQMRVNLIFPKATFHRIVREIAIDYHEGFCWQAAALDVLQVAAEQTLVTLFEYKVTISSNKLNTNEWQVV
jgi:histone H3/H4